MNFTLGGVMTTAGTNDTHTHFSFSLCCPIRAGWSHYLPSGSAAAGCPGSPDDSVCQCWACRPQSSCLCPAPLAAHTGGCLAAGERTQGNHFVKSVGSQWTYAYRAFSGGTPEFIDSPSGRGRSPPRGRWASATCCRPRPRSSPCPHWSGNNKAVSHASVHGTWLPERHLYTDLLKLSSIKCWICTQPKARGTVIIQLPPATESLQRLLSPWAKSVWSQSFCQQSDINQTLKSAQAAIHNAKGRVGDLGKWSQLRLVSFDGHSRFLCLKWAAKNFFIFFLALNVPLPETLPYIPGPQYRRPCWLEEKAEVLLCLPYKE